MQWSARITCSRCILRCRLTGPILEGLQEAVRHGFAVHFICLLHRWGRDGGSRQLRRSFQGRRARQEAGSSCRSCVGQRQEVALELRGALGRCLAPLEGVWHIEALAQQRLWPPLLACPDRPLYRARLQCNACMSLLYSSIWGKVLACCDIPCPNASDTQTPTFCGDTITARSSPLQHRYAAIRMFTHLRWGLWSHTGLLHALRLGRDDSSASEAAPN